MGQKLNYFHSLISDYSQDNARVSLAERELATLRRLLALAFGNDAFSIGTLSSNIPSSREPRFPIRSVLDLGAGDQFLKSSFERRNVSYSSLDVDDCDFESDNFPYQDSSFDCVVSLAVIEHLRDPSNFLLESMRVLKSGGFIWLSTPNWQFCSKTFYNDYTHVKPYTPFSLVRLLRDFGFEESIAFPNLRCKPDWCYVGHFPYLRAKYMFPLPGTSKLPVPGFLKGKSSGIFALAKKP